MRSNSHDHGKTALVLAGGGLTGAVYEIGALRAIDDLLVERTVNDFDIYVGTSAGALVCALLANGLSPETMLKALAGDHTELPPLRREDLLALDYRDLLRQGLRLPGRLAKALRHYLRNAGQETTFDLLWQLSEGLPSGLYSNATLERYVRRVIAAGGQSNDFRQLDRDLHIISTDLDSGRRVIFSRDSHGQVPVSLAVAASTALPVLYKPVRIGDCELVDGGLRGNASLDVAIEHGAQLVVCINPLVPIDNDDRRAVPDEPLAQGHLSEKGFTAVASQVGRINSHAGLHYHVKQLRRANPAVDVILIEPRTNDHEMFFHNIMRYSVQVEVAQHGFESVTLQLAEQYPQMKVLLSRHGIKISRRLVEKELEEIRASGYRPEVTRRVLEARARHYAARAWASPFGHLRRTLEALDDELRARAPSTPEAKN